MAYLEVEDGTSKVPRATKINNKIIKGMPANDEDSIMLVNIDTNTTPIFDFLNILIKIEAKKINTNVLPVPSSE